MARPFSKRLVIDASIARSAGGPLSFTASLHPLPDDPDPGQYRSRQCRRILLAVLQICHRLVLTEDLREEWEEHRSRFSRRWLTRMVAKDKVKTPAVTTDHELQQAINDFARGVSDDFEVITSYRQAMQKDRLLLEAALASDELILSLNEKDRRRFAEACDEIQSIQTIVWSNPAGEDENSLDWIKQGASPEPHLRLKNYPPG